MIFKNEEKIKTMIMDGKRRGICDSEGDSVHDEFNHAVAKTHQFRDAKVFVYRQGKMIRIK